MCEEHPSKFIKSKAYTLNNVKITSITFDYEYGNVDEDEAGYHVARSVGLF